MHGMQYEKKAAAADVMVMYVLCVCADMSYVMCEFYMFVILTVFLM